VARVDGRCFLTLPHGCRRGRHSCSLDSAAPGSIRSQGCPASRAHLKTTGDGLLAEFANVVEAVRCAIELQRQMALRNDDVPSERRIQFRIGINVGDIIIEADDIYGDCVNVAARLEAMAAPGGICISAIVHDQVQGGLECAFADLGEQSLKKNYPADPSLPRRTANCAGGISVCRPSKSCMLRWKRAAHKCAPASASISCAVMRTRAPPFLTDRSRT